MFKDLYIYYILFFLIVLKPHSGQCQVPKGDTAITLRFEAIDQEEGMPEHRVFEILEDHLGLIWFGTPRGLVKYDGYGFQYFQYEPEDSVLKTRQFDGMKVYILTEGPSGDLWIGSGFERPDKPAIFRFDRETEKIIPYLFNPHDSLPPIHSGITSIQEDSQYIWVSTMQERSLIRIKPEKEYSNAAMASKAPFEWINHEYGLLPNEHIYHILKDKEGRLWLGGTHGLYLWKPEQDTFRYFESEAMAAFEDKYCQLTGIEEGPDGKLWIHTHRCDGFFCFDPENGRYQYHAMRGSMDIMPDDQGKIWIAGFAGRGGIGWYDEHSGRLTNINVRPDGLDFFPVVRVREYLQDRYGMMWVGSMEGPLLKYNPQRAAFHWLKAEPSTPNSLSHNWVTDIEQDADGHYWISTFGGGLNRWNPDANSFTHYNDGPNSEMDLNFPYILDLTIDNQGKVWYGFPYTATFEPKSRKVQQYPERGGSVNSLYTDSRGQVWIGQYRSLGKYLPETDRFKDYDVIVPEAPNIRQAVRKVMEDSHGDIWGGIVGGIAGYFRFKQDTEQFELFKSAAANSFYECSKGYIWVATLDGLFRVDPETGNRKRFDTSDGLPHNNVQSILEDNNGLLWLGTENGLSRFDSDQEIFRNYYKSDGLPSNSFFNACYKNKKGELFFGGTFGIVYFHPDSIRDNTIPPKLVFVQMDVLGEPLIIGGHSPLQKHISVTRKVELDHWQNDLTVHYAALHYKNPAQNRYKIKLDNYDERWQEMGTQRIANYTNLDPGHYLFRVTAANSDGIWNEDGISLDIVISPPWYWNAWSQLIYALIFFGALYWFYHFQLKRRLALAETARLKELDSFKTQLYTNITHEFRTPLTIIQGMIDYIKGHDEEKEIIKRNSHNLLKLINRLLGLSKLDAGKLKLNLVQGDILPFLRYVTESFHSYALSQKINLYFHSEANEIIMDYDPEKVLEVLSNLLSNALKFTPVYGKVQVVASIQAAKNNPKSSRSDFRLQTSDFLQLTVADTGIGIAPDRLPHIFDRFYQAEAESTRRAEGTGIGLALAKELVELMNGQIEVDSVEGEGTKFTVSLPITREAVAIDVDAIVAIERPTEATVIATLETSSTDYNSEAEEGIAFDSSKNSLLLVEDNHDVMQYLTSCLQDDYTLLYARNGSEGIEQAQEHIPDIIISDVMMPEVDGFELCKTLKQDERSSHIPIILLTARADMESKLEGLEYGADAYLVKPFQREELEVRLHKLIELRRKLQERYNQPDFQPEPAMQKEDAFILKVKETLLAKLDDENFGIEELSEALHLSRVHLHRKLKALTGEPTSHFIRQLRLQEAYKLLKEGGMNVSEVAYRVGYKDPGYFSKLFSEQYGKPPSEV